MSDIKKDYFLIEVLLGFILLLGWYLWKELHRPKNYPPGKRLFFFVSVDWILLKAMSYLRRQQQAEK